MLPPHEMDMVNSQALLSGKASNGVNSEGQLFSPLPLHTIISSLLLNLTLTKARQNPLPAFCEAKILSIAGGNGRK